jgi:hypothetical protein
MVPRKEPWRTDYRTHLVLNRRSRARHVRKLHWLERQSAEGSINSQALQQLATALTPFVPCQLSNGQPAL